MGLFGKRAVVDSAAINAVPIVLADRAIHCLLQAIEVEPEDSESLVEERVTWQPDSWLLQRTWQTLADGGAGEEALRVAQMVEPRAPLAPAQALYRLAQQSIVQPALTNLVRRELRLARQILFADPKFVDPKNGENKNSVIAGDTWRQVERLLFYGAGAAISGEPSLALACIERADQWERVWERVMITPEPRNLLAQIVARVGLHPLTSQLVSLAVRRYEDSGAQFLHQIASIIGPRVPHEQLPRRIARLLQRCVETFEFSTLTTLTARRYAANLFGQAGRIHELLDQIVTISNVQEARRDSGLSGGRGDSQSFRQVKRVSANPDVDFQVYTLQEAIQAMPVRTITRDERIALADKLAALAVRSDGWTAAGATSSLMELGAYKYAVNVVDHIPSHDPTRSEGVIALVRALLAMGETQLANEQVRKALAWVKSLDTRNPERATIWGLVEVYLDAALPDAALRLLDQRTTPPTWAERMRRLFQNSPNDDELRNDRLRFQALLQQGATWDKELYALLNHLRQWAPRLLDGEMLMSFYIDGLLRPLLASGRADLIWSMLPEVRAALNASSGDKHAAQVQRVTLLLASQAVPDIAGALTSTAATVVRGSFDGKSVDAGGFDEESAGGEMSATANNNGDGVTSSISGADALQAHAELTQFLVQLWDADVLKGLWQTVHGIEGSLALLLALDGPEALMTLAQFALREGSQWVKPWQPKEKEAIPRPMVMG